MNWLDAIILLPLLIGLVRGLMRGLVSEFIAILAVILGCVGAKIWGSAFSIWIAQQFAWPETVCDIVAYALLFLGIAVVLNLFGRLISRLLRAIHLGFLNRLLGAAFGAAKYAIIVLGVVFIVDKLDQQFQFMQPELKNSSVTYRPAVKSANYLLGQIHTHANVPVAGSEHRQ